jgi:nucleoside-diphosphate-sugar epimerase
MRAKVPPNYVFTENDWSSFTENVVAKMGPELNSLAYFASKPIAERAMWDFVEIHKPNWSVSAIHPAVVTGPPIHHVSHPNNLNDTLKPIWDLFSGTTKKLVPATAGGAYVDVRDVATIFAFAVEHPDLVNGKRLPLVGGYGPTQAVVDILREAYPERRGLIPEGKSGRGYRTDWKAVEGSTSISAKLVEEMTGLEWMPFDISIRDTARSFEKFVEQGSKF